MMITLSADHTTIPMGRSVRIEARLDALNPRDWLLLPFVNQRRWGAHETPTADGRAVFTLPLPNPGPAQVQILTLPRDPSAWMGISDSNLLMAGHLLAEGDLNSPRLLSHTLDLRVTSRTIAPPDNHGSLFCMQWEPWFDWGPRGWQTAQSVPVIGFYDSYNRDSIRQHMLWMMDLGVDFILPDWTNHLWGKAHWDERPDGVNAIVHATTLFLETLADMRAEGLPAPKVALFPGISNGRPTTMEALNEELAWIYHTYVRNPRFEGLWQELDGKPLMVVLDTGAVGDKRGTAESAFRIPFFKQTLEMSAEELDAFRAAQGPVDEHFTVRWMSSQNQATRHHELGFWSWMDGVIDPPVTYRDGQAESVTVTPSFFNALGWTGPGAYGRRGGATYLDTFKTALAHHPKVIFLHQFNEFTGQREGHGMGPNRDIYVDTFNVEFSDDLEPVSTTAPGYRSDSGGWGYYYLNLTRALMDLYRDPNFDSTLLAVSHPLPGATLGEESVEVCWSTLGVEPQSVTVLLDRQVAAAEVKGTSAVISLAGLAAGPHTLTVIAEGAATRYPLSLEKWDEPLEEPIEVKKEIGIII
jgi:hypothetical protein